MAVFECDCGARYRFADEHVGKQARCRKCGKAVVLYDSSGPIAIASEESAGPEAVEQGKIVAPAGSPAAAGSLTVEHGAIHGDLVPVVSYASDVLWTFLFLSSPSNLTMFLVIWGVMCTLQWAAGLVFILLLPQILFLLWYVAFRMAIVESAAAGGRDLPSVSFGTDIVDELVRPLGRWIASWVFVMAPAATFLIVSVFQDRITTNDVLALLSGGIVGLFQTGGTPMLPFSVLLAAGLFFWPMVLMCVALGGIDTLVRFDLMFISIMRSIPAYVLMLLLMLGAMVLDYFVHHGFSQFIGLAAGGASGGRAMGRMLPLMVGAGFELYLNIVLMRLIGLYYHHHKEKLAWWWG